MTTARDAGARFNEPRKTTPTELRAYADAEVAELFEQLGFDPISGPFYISPIEYWRGVIDQAALLYFCWTDDPKPNAQDKHLEKVAKNARALLNALGPGLAPHMRDVEPPGLRRTLSTLAEQCDKARERIAPEVNHAQKQKKRTALGKDAAITYLYEELAWQSGKDRPPSIYIKDPISNRYIGGDLFNFVVNVFRILKADLSEQTIGDTIARLSARGALQAPQPLPEHEMAALNAYVNARKAFSEPKQDPP